MGTLFWDLPTCCCLRVAEVFSVCQACCLCPRQGPASEESQPERVCIFLHFVAIQDKLLLRVYGLKFGGPHYLKGDGSKYPMALGIEYR